MCIELASILIGLPLGVICAVCPSFLPIMASPVGIAVAVMAAFSRSYDVASVENIVGSIVLLAAGIVLGEAVGCIAKTTTGGCNDEKTQTKKHDKRSPRRVRN